MEKYDVKRIKIEVPFKDLFPVESDTLRAIKDDIKKHGYDESQPIIVWKGKDVVVDGHMRLQAVMNLGMSEILVHERDFKDEDEAFDYAVHNQRDRRNLTDADIMRLVEVVDERKKHGATQEKDEKGRYIKSNKTDEPSHVTTAKTIGMSPSKVQQTRKVIDEATPKEKEAIKKKEQTIHKTFKDIKEREAKERKPKSSKKPSEKSSSEALSKHAVALRDGLRMWVDKKIEPGKDFIYEESDAKEQAKYAVEINHVEVIREAITEAVECFEELGIPLKEELVTVLNEEESDT